MGDENVVTEQPISATKVDATEFSLFGSGKELEGASLDVLTNYESLIVKQELDFMGSVCDKCFCCDKLNKYKIKDMNGKTILSAVEEEESCCASNCCRRGQRFEMKIKDEKGREVIRLQLKNQCCGQCFCFCRYEKLQVFSPTDTKIGSIEESCNCFHKQLLIYSVSNSEPIYSINGPNCESCRCCCPGTKFSITNYETDEECGTIAKKWSGLAKEALTYADNFCINFPTNIELNEKAVLLGACIMIDLMYFEKTPKKAKDDDD